VINFMGKSLVFLHTLISLVAMAWAIGLFLQFTDWGWKEPRQELETRIASEFDKSAAALKLAVKARDMVLPPIKPAHDRIAEAEARYPANHLFYLQELEKLRGEPLLPGKASFLAAKGAFEAKEFKGPGLPLDNNKATGKPILETKIEGLEKPLLEYRSDLDKVKGEVVKVEKDIEAVLEKTKEITYTLTGMDDTGKKVTIGLYDLVDAEYESLTRARAEYEDLKPIWAQTLEEARLYSTRRVGLETILDSLKKTAATRR
jgi:hypothetical protein